MHGRRTQPHSTRGKAPRSETPEPTERLFVGVWPPPAVAAAVASFERPSLDTLRWTTAEQWHVTIAFLGSVPVSKVQAIGGALLDAAATVPGQPDARLGPATQRVGRSVLCVPVSGLDDLAAVVQGALREVLPGAGAGGPFRGHLTLARGRGRHAVPASMAGAPLEARWQVGEVALVRSLLDPSGARYTTLLRATLPS